MTTQNVELFERWIRSEFRDINTELENLYFDQDQRDNVDNVGEELKQQLLSQGNKLVGDLLKEGNTNEGFDAGFDLLGNVGFFYGGLPASWNNQPRKRKRLPA